MFTLLLLLSKRSLNMKIPLCLSQVNANMMPAKDCRVLDWCRNEALQHCCRVDSKWIAKKQKNVQIVRCIPQILWLETSKFQLDIFFNIKIICGHYSSFLSWSYVQSLCWLLFDWTVWRITPLCKCVYWLIYRNASNTTAMLCCVGYTSSYDN